MKSVNFYFFHGRPAGGKNTQAYEFRQRLQDSAVEIVPGDIFNEILNPPETGINPRYKKFIPMVESHRKEIDEGHIIKEEDTMDMVKELIVDYRTEGINTFVFTGFPRTIHQLDLLDRYERELKQNGESVQIKHLVYITPEELTKERARYRRETSDHPRKDDSPETVEERLRVYKKNTLPMIAVLAYRDELISIRGDEDKRIKDAYQQGLIAEEEKRNLEIREISRRTDEKVFSSRNKERV